MKIIFRDLTLELVDQIFGEHIFHCTLHS
uniref:Uncharacterized protein n=1 Tax=Rhizophora mucronata TaxID=61149 RepID=A0A2P2QGZ9_RHIMU